MQRSRTQFIKAGQSRRFEGLTPDAPFWAIGDVHGCAALLEKLLTKTLASGDPVVLVGDYINKGPHTADVLKMLHTASQTDDVTALRGNHEDLLLRFLDRPRVYARQFILYGGNATLESFGAAALTEDSNPKAAVQSRDTLAAALGELRPWLSSLPFHYQSGNVAVIHAGAAPDQPVASQKPKSLLWGHPQFDKVARQDGLWVVHGHRQTAAVAIKDRRIAIDTGAYHSGTLTAVHIAPNNLTVA